MHHRRPADLVNIFRLLRKLGVRNFEKSIPSLLLDLVYDLIWDILLKAKKIAKHAGRLNITTIDLEVACKLEFEKINYNNRALKGSIFSCVMLNSLHFTQYPENEYREFKKSSNKLMDENFKLKF